MTTNDVLALLTGVLATFPVIVAGAMHLLQRLDAKLPTAQRAQLEKLVTQAVQAIEQKYKYNPVNFRQKKAQAIELALSLVAHAHLPPPLEQDLDSLIEQAVALLPDTFDHSGSNTNPLPLPAPTISQQNAAPLFPKSNTMPMTPPATLPVSPQPTSAL